MIDKEIYFLSGLPRTGSTLLGAILAQNPLIHVTPTSPLCPLLINTTHNFGTLSTQHTFDADRTYSRICHAIIDAFYADVPEPIIFDKHRIWPENCTAIQQFINPIPRIICTVRPIAEIVTSYLVLADKDYDNFIDNHLVAIGVTINNFNRAMLLWQEYIRPVYLSMKDGLENHRENILICDYRDIVFHLDKTLDKIYKFCGIVHYQHKKDDIVNRCAEEKDKAWGLPGLHDIRPSLSYISADPLSYIPKSLFENFAKYDDALMI